MKIINYLLCLLLGACSTMVRVPAIEKSNTTYEEALKAWSNIVQNYVNDVGAVDFKAVRNNPKDLHTFIYFISNTRFEDMPELNQSLYHRLAYYINSYNALSMYNIIEAGIPESLSGLKKVKFFYFTKLKTGGVEMSLYDYENKIIRALGDEHVHFALNCMSKGCPRLPRYVFDGITLKDEFEKQAKFFFNEDRNVKVDESKKEVSFSEILKFYTEDFLKNAPSLIEYANRYREKKIQEDYSVSFIPYDWEVNNFN